MAGIEDFFFIRVPDYIKSNKKCLELPIQAANGNYTKVIEIIFNEKDFGFTLPNPNKEDEPQLKDYALFKMNGEKLGNNRDVKKYFDS